MKRLFFILTLVGASIFSSSYAADIKTSPVVLQSFQSSFAGATEISWKQVGVLYKATFALNGQYTAAFYNMDGELVAITQNMPLAQLPKALQANLKKELNNSWVSELFVVNIEGENTYYAQIENADTKILLKSAGTKWITYQKDQK
jgi:hypothetical protein